MSDPLPFSAGLVLDGRYRLERPLGQGGMGTVWVGTQLSLGREVAIKAIRAGRSHDQARLEREARLLASLRHPAIVQVFDFGRSGGHGYLVMELVHGPSLEARLMSVGRLTAEEAVGVVLPLLEGLSAVHAAGVVHRDVKPANVLLVQEGSQVSPKLVDFGIARDGAGQQLTREGDVVGTPAYMAPEQFLGRRVDHRADVWGVAATLYDLISGEPPFLGANLFEIMRRVESEPPSFPRDALGLDGKLWGIVTRALRKDPAERHASAEALRTELHGWLRGRGVPAAPPRLPMRAQESAPTEPPPPTSSSVPPAPGAPSLDTLIRARLRET